MDLLDAKPAFDLLFSLDRGSNAFCRFVVDQFGKVVCSGETREFSSFVFVDSSRQVVGYTCVEDAVSRVA